jgi:REP element-mobilizing transposase RayT
MKIHELGIVLEAIEFGPEHVHLFVTNCQKYDVPTMLHHIKGFSSWFLRKNYWDLFKDELWGDSFWSDGKFFESIGRVTADNVKFYITRQQEKHWIFRDMDQKSEPAREPKSGQSRLEVFCV